MAKTNSIPIEILREFLACDPLTGVLTWRWRDPKHFKNPGYASRWNGRYAGKQAFIARANTGYFVGRIFDQGYLGHRVIWALVHGEWPEHEIDHINGDRADNRISNLREVTHLENLQNQKLRSDNTSGTFGVSWSNTNDRWVAVIKAHDRLIHLGSFRSKRMAIAARKAGEIRYGFHPNHGRVEAALT